MNPIKYEAASGDLLWVCENCKAGGADRKWVSRCCTCRECGKQPIHRLSTFCERCQDKIAESGIRTAQAAAVSENEWGDKPVFTECDTFHADTDVAKEWAGYQDSDDPRIEFVLQSIPVFARIDIDNLWENLVDGDAGIEQDDVYGWEALQKAIEEFNIRPDTPDWYEAAHNEWVRLDWGDER